MVRNRTPAVVKGRGSGTVKYYGLYRAKCINNKDPRGLGRILVHVYKRDGNLSYDESIHQWVPVLSPYGGIKGMGFYMIPPIHAEGFVIFEGGESSKPIWIGTFPYAPTKEIDEEASKAAGYGVVKVTPTIPPELEDDPTKIIIKTQYPSLNNSDPEDDSNKVENVITMDESKLELLHVNQNDYEFSQGGVSTSDASSYLTLKDNSLNLGVKGADGRVFEIQINSDGIKLVTSLGDQLIMTDGSIQLIGSDAAQINIKTESGSVNINGKQVILDGDQIVSGPPGTLGGGGAVTTDCICPFTGLPTHIGSTKTIIGG